MAPRIATVAKPRLCTPQEIRNINMYLLNSGVFRTSAIKFIIDAAKKELKRTGGRSE